MDPDCSVSTREGEDGLIIEQSVGDEPVHRDPVASPNLDQALARERKRHSRKRARTSKRRRKQVNTSIYIAGIPKDACENDLASHFAKCGILQPNPDTGRPRIKIYLDASGNAKGDALVTYAMAPSVDNALSILDGVPLRAGEQGLKVERASFEHKEVEGIGVDQVAKRRKEEMQSEEAKRRGLRRKALVTEALSWADEGQESNFAHRIVILKNVFDAANADYEIVRADMEEGCSACGTVQKVSVFERNEEGAVAIKFLNLEACVKCIEVMDGRWYDGRKLSAEFYDGTKNFQYKETAEERAMRESKWEEWLGKHGDN